MTLANELRQLLVTHKRRHDYFVKEALARNLTQEYRTWHHTMANSLEPLLEDLEGLRGRNTYPRRRLRRRDR